MTEVKVAKKEEIKQPVVFAPLPLSTQELSDLILDFKEFLPYVGKRSKEGGLKLKAERGENAGVYILYTREGKTDTVIGTLRYDRASKEKTYTGRIPNTTIQMYDGFDPHTMNPRYTSVDLGKGSPITLKFGYRSTGDSTALKRDDMFMQIPFP